ncbi:hypothetical protein [Roseateles sp.]|uniref:hypothetical protein n=1 Tax=Roseateles sp. TaxID=1971397 RepID=UPI0039E7969C
MQIKTAADVEIARLDVPDDALPQAELVLAGRRTGWHVRGAVLEAALRFDDRLLLFMTDDRPYEESLSLHLLDMDGRLLDSATLDAPYSTGTFSDLAVEPPDGVRFRFIGGVDWRVRLLARRRWRWPPVPDAPGVRHRPGLTQYFVVSGRPQPQPR